MGNLVVFLGVAIGVGLAWSSTGTNEPIRRGPVAVALGGLQCGYQ